MATINYIFVMGIDLNPINIVGLLFGEIEDFCGCVIFADAKWLAVIFVNRFI